MKVYRNKKLKRFMDKGRLIQKSDIYKLFSYFSSLKVSNKLSQKEFIQKFGKDVKNKEVIASLYVFLTK